MMKLCLFHVTSLSLVFTVISGTLDCDSDTGPAGVAHCFLGTPYYSEYQCGTCLSDDYIRQRSKGEQRCRDTTATYCYYQCMLERYDLDSGPVYDDCLCDPDKPFLQPSVILPASCYSPDGTDCGWYRQCLARMFDCTGQTEYAISYGEKFCNLYGQSQSGFSPRARQWIDATRKCLQVALVPALRLCQVKPTCEDIKRMAFESHVPCYVEPYQGFSVCNLDPSDWVKIFWTIKSGFLPPTFVETFKAFVLTVDNCIGIWSVHLPEYFYSVDVQVQEKFRAKRDMFSDDELAHAIMLQISSTLGWTQESTIDWYAFAANTSTINGSRTTSAADQPGRELVIQLFLVDRVDIGLLNITDATGLRRLNDTIAQFSDVIQQRLTGTVHNFRFGVTSLRQCGSVEGINDGCSRGTVIAYGDPDISNSATCTGKMGTYKRIHYGLLAIMALYIIDNLYFTL